MKRLLIFTGLILMMGGCSSSDQLFSADTAAPPAEETEENVENAETPEPDTSVEENIENDVSSDTGEATVTSIVRDVSLTPSRVTIPAIGVDAVVNPYGLDNSGGMAVPDNGEEVAWFEPGYKPGQRGNAVLAGHVDSEKAPAVFWDLKELSPGDEITVTDPNGESLVFVVKDSVAYETGEAPIEEIFGSSPERGLNLITCTGYFDRSNGGYVERLVVYTELKADQS
ncbi:class F sortase [Jeotgalibacillus haloalkalitolerans]|uniref:Class F sortase n=1 Tax=Jeotgalibacillus haloalkalitolerans TaxID=3104292 RepID=A0ABU5KNW8_9BACL|nr:class F sortase [Jeotgalibacillus sp. HH7-29]MDZ5712958.1 class F sortase [Jeotgalibacillus sp. HH7-29]